jgi:hypothetical protein
MTTTKDIHSAAQALGHLGGLAKSKAKAKAVRENGKLGGRTAWQERQQTTQKESSHPMKILTSLCRGRPGGPVRAPSLEAFI